jgi:hypothetical protein
MTAPEAAELEAVDDALAGRAVHPDHAELAELALLLRDERPEPAPAWAARLDRRVEARFPAAPRKRRDWTWFRNVAPAIALLLIILPIGLIAALGSSGTDDGGGDAGISSSGGAEAGGGSMAAPEASTDRSGGSALRADGRRQRAVERSAELTLSAPRRSLDRVASRVPDVAADLGGYVARSSVSSEGGGDFRLRVPTRQLDEAIQRLSRLGRVRNVSRNSLDITSTVVSRRARLTDARTERESLLRQLAEADTVNETESIRARLAIVSREIAAARNSLRRVRNRASFADLSITLVPASGDDQDEGAWTPGDAFDDALRVLEVVAGIAVMALAIVLPLLAVWLLAWLAHRAVTRRRRERSLDVA